MKKKKERLYVNLLKKNKEFRGLFYAQATSTLGDWFNTIALLSFVYITTNSPLMISFTLISNSLPQLLASPFAGVFVDKSNRKVIMVVTDFVRAIVILGLLFAENYIYIVFIVNIILGLCTTLFNPARQSVLPNIVNKKDFTTANSLSSSMKGVASIIGASLGGLIAGLITPNIAFIINSLTFVISGLIISKVNIPSTEKRDKNVSFFRDMKEGYIFIIKTPIILALVLVGVSWGVVGGVYQVLLTLYGSDIFGMGSNGVGILYTTQGIGVVIGGLLVAKFVGSNVQKMKKYYGWAYLLQGIFFIFFAISTNIYLGVASLLLMRIAGGVIIPLDTTLLQSYSPDDKIGKVFTLHFSVYGSIFQLSMFFTGILLESFSPQVIGVSFGLLCTFISCTWLLLLQGGFLDSKDGQEEKLA